MAQDLMRYDIMTREALRDVVRQALVRASSDGLPGAHHFYITFKTRAEGVDLDPSLLEKYPDEMTVVLEHQFWDLDVDETAFEVTLKFNGIPKYLKVPFDSVVQFHDPSVGFTLRFERAEDEADAEDAPALASAPSPEVAAKAKEAADGAEVVSLDAFRKK